MVSCKCSLQLKITIASPIIKDLFSHSGLTKREEKKGSSFNHNHYFFFLALTFRSPMTYIKKNHKGFSFVYCKKVLAFVIG
jgi:hypothetical protein